LTGIVDGSELSENSNDSSTFNDETSNPIDTSDVHQKGKIIIQIFFLDFTIFFLLVLSIDFITNE
jgi:hypothetical protein